MDTAVFIGHSKCYNLSIDKLEEAIKQCIENGITQFLSGGQGEFDRICAYTVFRLKSRHPHIKNILVIPYLSFNIFNEDIFDEILYPNEFEKYYYKVAIPQRNKYMVCHSDIAICYINHS